MRAIRYVLLTFSAFGFCALSCEIYAQHHTLAIWAAWAGMLLSYFNGLLDGERTQRTGEQPAPRLNRSA